MIRLSSVLFCICATLPACGAVVITITQVGNDLLVKGSGSLDLSGAMMIGFSMDNPGPAALFLPHMSYFTTRTETWNDVERFLLINDPSILGNQFAVATAITSGDSFGISTNEVHVPVGYMNGENLTISALFLNETVTSLGLIPGTYLFSLPHDFVKLDIVAVPEPNVLQIWALIVVTLLGFRKR